MIFEYILQHIAGHAFGINLDGCFDEVQKSNMSKLGDDGKPIIMSMERS